MRAYPTRDSAPTSGAGPLPDRMRTHGLRPSQARRARAVSVSRSRSTEPAALARAILVPQRRERVLAVELRDHLKLDLLRADRFAGAGVGAGPEAELVVLAN